MSRIPSGELSESVPVGGGSSGLLARAGATGTLLPNREPVVRELEISHIKVSVGSSQGWSTRILLKTGSFYQVLSLINVGYAASGPKSGEGGLGSEGSTGEHSERPKTGGWRL